MDISDIITTGGDERIRLRENGLNKYFVHPAKYKGVLNRGSCTVNLLTDETCNLAKKTIEKVQNVGYPFVRSYQAKELKELLQFDREDSFELFFAPSGSDLCYYPLLFAKLLHPGTPVHNIITCPEELGSGSLAASKGQYFFNISQFDEIVEPNTQVDPELQVSVKTFPARDSHGRIINHRKAILSEIYSKRKQNTIIGNLVIGSKSGIYDNTNIIPDAPADTLWVVDMCQFRTARSLIHELLDLNAMIMITGSKFYQAPPFCGALVVPKEIIKKINSSPVTQITPFTRIFSKYDIPECLPQLRNHFRDHENVGLLLRWEAAIHEMRIMSQIKPYTVLSGISRWNAHITNLLQAESTYFKLMPDQDLTNKTIISFQLRAKDGQFLTDTQLREVYQRVTMSSHKGLKGYNKVIIGQPVKYKGRSFIRLALGANDLRKLFDKDFDLHNDNRIIEIIKEQLKILFW